MLFYIALSVYNKLCNYLFLEVNALDFRLNIMALSLIKGMGKQRIVQLMNWCIENDYMHSNLTLSVMLESPVPLLHKLINDGQLDSILWSDCLNKAQKIIEKHELEGISIISYLDTNYPKEFFVLNKKPVLLYAKGNLELLLDENKVAVIGTREPSSFAQKMAYKVSQLLLDEDFTIVSGLAEGCDSIGHQAAVDTTGKTIAILAAGLDQPIYPKQNTALAQQILENGGLLLSEYPNGTRLNRNQFVARDEWQSGLSLGTFVVEGGLKSGTRHASYKTLEQDRVLGVLNPFELKVNNQYVFDKDDAQVQLNKALLAEEKSISIFEKEDVQKFIEAMIVKKEQIARNYEEKRPKLLGAKTQKSVKSDDSIYIQESLF